VAGALLAAALLAGLAEVHLRSSPPQDLYAYLGEASPLPGPFVPADDFGVGYRSWDAFRADTADALRKFGAFGPVEDGRPIWALFGNSFVQAPGMLADQVRAGVPDRRAFNLGRNELLIIRLAQVRLLLEHGLRPERVIMALMPLDVGTLGYQPLSTLCVTSRGAVTYRPRLPPGPAGWLIEHSRLALAGWVRAGRHRGTPGFHPRRLNNGIDEPLLGDLRTLFGNLAHAAAAQHVPVTVLLIPTYEQVMRGAPCGFQDTLAALLRGQGYDVLDPREAFRSQPDRSALFLPDKHFTPLGNRVLLGELLAHLPAARQP
jgi:hypothetical protein